MSEIYDNWERLVAATIKKQQLWVLFHSHSRTPSILSETSSSDVLSSVISFNAESSPIDIGVAVNSGLMQWASNPSDVTPLYEHLLDHRVLLRDNSSASDINAALRYKNTTAFIKSEVTAAVPPYVEYSSPLSGDYLDAVDEIIQLRGGLKLHLADHEAKDRADNELQQAMIRLEEAFRSILTRNNIRLVPDDSIGGQIHPDAVVDLRDIADRMIRSGYEKECCQVYCSVRRDVLDECLAIFGVEKFSIEEVQRIEWRALDDKMKKWIHAVKQVARGLLLNEKRLCEEIFSGSDFIKKVCFLETSKVCVIQLLNFGEAVALGKRSAERLFRFLDMYDALSEVLPDLQSLFMDEDAGDMICSEAKVVLDSLGGAAIGTFVVFENAVQGEASRKPIHNGEIHPLTRYVMNYAKLLVDYSDTLNALLENVEVEAGMPKIENNDSKERESLPLLAQRLLALIGSLESNIEEKSRMYEDAAMQYIFLMNNILYIVQKVKDSELRNLLGDNWIKKRRGLIRQYATHYLRASWSKALSFLKDDGIGVSSSNASKVALKERFKNFNACFEDIIRIQTAWKVPDPQVREHLRICISEMVIPAYRSFMGRFGSHLESWRHAGRYIKYTSEDLENYVLDLFEGTPLILHHIKRKNT